MHGLAREELEPPFSREHGGPSEQELGALGIDPSEIVDFSVSVNPYGPPPSVARAVLDAPIDRYPDPTAFTARRALARAFAVDPEEVVLGNGAADLLWALARLLVRPGGIALVVEPTFSEFRSAAISAGARLLEWRARAVDRFDVDLGAIAGLVRSEQPDVLYLCTPNTPTGVAIPASDIAALAAAAPEVAIVLDQSFLSLSDSFADALARFPENVVCVRSLTKDHAIPGVRVGYMIASRRTARRVELSRPAWATSAAAQAAAVAACREGRFVEESRLRLAADRERLMGSLQALGLDPIPSAAPFFLVESRDASDLRRRLLTRHRILVRDCASFGLPRFMRLSARPPEDVDCLVAALTSELL